MRQSIIGNNIISEDGTSVSINLYWESTDIQDFEGIFIRQIAKAIEPFSGKFDRIFQAGPPQTRMEVTRLIAQDQNILIPFAIFVVFFLIVVTTRSVNGAVLPLITSGFSLIFTYGFMGAMGIPMTTAFLAPAIIMGAGRGSCSWIRSWKYVMPMPLPASMVAGSTFFNAI